MKKNLLSLFSALFFSFSAFAQMPINGLVSSYRFEGNLLTDSHGANTLSTNNMPVLGSGYQNLASTAAAFSSDGILGSTSSDFQLTSFTFSTWVNVASANFYHTFGNVRMNVSTFPYNSFILVSGTYVNNQLTFFFNTDAHLSSGMATTDLYIQDPSSMAYSTWYLATVTVNYDATDNETEIHLYKNGSEVASVVTPGQIVYLGNPFTLGNINGASNTNNGLIGSLDEVLFYNRALSTVEVCELYNYYMSTTCGLTVAAPTNLSASAVGQQVTLNWTDNSNNETYFRVVTGTDGVTFTNVLGDVTANTTTYSYTAQAGTHYYRVYAYSASDVSDSTNIASVVVSAPNGLDEISENNIQVYPNPAASVLMVKSNEQGNALVLNHLGQTVLSTKLNAQLTSIDISLLLPGIYFLQMGETMVKFVKE